MRVTFTTVATLIPALAAALVGCGSSGDPSDNPGGLVHARAGGARPVRADQAADDPSELARAMAQPHRVLAAAIGPHVVRGASALVVRSEGSEVESLDDTLTIEVEADGDYHALLENSADYGREVFFVDGALYQRPRYGRFHVRPPTSESEPLSIRDDMVATLGDYFELLAPAAAATDAGEIDYQGRKARKVTLSRASTPRQRDESLPQREWRESVAVGEVSGELVLDAETGAPLAGKVRGSVSFVREGRTFEMDIQASHEVTLGPPAGAIQVPEPELAVRTPPRPSEIADHEALLEGIAAPPGARKPKPLPEGAPRVWRKRQLRELERQRLLDEAQQQEGAP